jgi:hypothetical protein
LRWPSLPPTEEESPTSLAKSSRKTMTTSDIGLIDLGGTWCASIYIR